MLQELRIGNWYNEFGNYRQVSWSTLKILLESSEDQIWCKPIPLTPEIIPKCITLELEASTDDWDRYRTANGWILGLAKYTQISEAVFEGSFYQSCYCGFQFRKIEYVHDLQNLHFCTNRKKELEFIW